jgi:hypothetical protein
MKMKLPIASCALASLVVLSVPGCKPYRSSPAGPCGGFYSEHETEHGHDVSVTNDGDDLVFRYTNVSKSEGRKPVWSMFDSDSLYSLHLHYEPAGVTVGCLDPMKYPDWRGQSPEDPKWVLPAGHSVTKRFSQTRVWKAMREETPHVVLEDGTPLRFIFDGFASNLCTVDGPQTDGDSQRLVCTPSTPEQRAKENRQRRSWWDRIANREEKQIWRW